MLDLNEFIDNEVIEFGKYKFTIPSDLSEKTILMFDEQIRKLQNVDPKEQTDLKSVYENIRKIIKEILYLQNGKWIWQRMKVNKFVKDLGYKSLLKTITFISEYIGKDTTKKKD